MEGKMNEQLYKQKGENYIPLRINARGIRKVLLSKHFPHYRSMGKFFSIQGQLIQSELSNLARICYQTLQPPKQ